MSTRLRQVRAAMSIMIRASPPISARSGRTSTENPATKASAPVKARLSERFRSGCDQHTIIHHSKPRYASVSPLSRPDVAKSRAGGSAM